MPTRNTPTVAIIGGGPAGLMAAETLAANGIQADVYDAMPSVGRKFLLAGKGGLNLTHAEPYADFLARYGDRQPELQAALDAFRPNDLRDWAWDLGVPTFIGSSGRVFPVSQKAAPLLRAWLRRLREAGVHFHMRHRWQGFTADGGLRFDTPQGSQTVRADTAILALGGGSWPQLGSDGAWAGLLAGQGVAVEPLRPANCGFDCSWSEYFHRRHAGQPVKPVAITYADADGQARQRLGEFIITATGVEGSLVYALSAPLREQIAAQGAALIYLDLAPGRDGAALQTALGEPRGSASMAKHLQRRASLSAAKVGLLRELAAPEDFTDPARLASAIKALPLRLNATRPLAEAISSAGGVAFAGLDGQLMIRSLPGVFCAGEMLDWEAPTGGYLLTACFATGKAAGLGALAWLAAQGYPAKSA
ncbi:MAG: TIGR03862 family flavoprotein [Candidatus Methylumidiphilus sp.]